MGYYLQCAEHHNKADQLVSSSLGARRVTSEQAKEFLESKAVVCVVSNGLFDAAAYCYSLDEYEQFNDPTDDRPKVWLVIDDKAKVEELTGYDQKPR